MGCPKGRCKPPVPPAVGVEGEQLQKPEASSATRATGTGRWVGRHGEKGAWGEGRLGDVGRAATAPAKVSVPASTSASSPDSLLSLRCPLRCHRLHHRNPPPLPLVTLSHLPWLQCSSWHKPPSALVLLVCWLLVSPARLPWPCSLAPVQPFAQWGFRAL